MTSLFDRLLPWRRRQREKEMFRDTVLPAEGSIIASNTIDLNDLAGNNTINAADIYGNNRVNIEDIAVKGSK